MGQQPRRRNHRIVVEGGEDVTAAFYNRDENDKGQYPAFPCSDGYQGLSMRDFIAALALAGVLASGNRGSVREYAETARLCADELLDQLKRNAPK
jgi:hypothetical protein